LDASLAILAAYNEGIDMETIRKAIGNYRGIEKRFDILQRNESFVLIDDYGHHPTEIEKTLQAVFEYRDLLNLDEVTAIWQPHKYSRTIDNIEHFQRCFKGVDRLVILPVWEAGEQKKEIDFKKIFAEYNPIFADRVYANHGNIQINDINLSSGIVIGFGAGDITYQLRGKI
jgi:UDP-N-acetylmuramate--alanine ligase